MKKIGAIIQSVKALLQPEAQDELIRQLDTSDTIGFFRNDRYFYIIFHLGECNS